jgi:hypothetical protein
MLQIIPPRIIASLFSGFIRNFSVIPLLGVSMYFTVLYSTRPRGYLQSASPMTRNVKENDRVEEKIK